MPERRVIKRYTNRKLYDKLESRYVTLEEIARLVRAGEDIQVIDNESDEDLTSVTFAQIILEEEKRKQNLLSVPFLRKLIRSGEARVQDFSDRASRSIEALGDLTEKAGERVREVVGGGRAFEGGRSFLDELFDLPQKRLAELGARAREQVDKIRGNPTVKRELERIAASLHTLEEAVAKMAEDDEQKAESQTESHAGSSGHERPAGESATTPPSGDVNEHGSRPATSNGASQEAAHSSDGAPTPPRSDEPDRGA
jgi:polyhydroxyalkanoate synthesis repressor PhaR